MTKNPEETYSHKETVERREAALKRILATPPQPHKSKGEKLEGSAGKKRIAKHS